MTRRQQVIAWSVWAAVGVVLAACIWAIVTRG